MQAVPTLAKALTHAPKFGGCGVIGYQSKPILEKVYGDHSAAALSGGCAVHCIYRANDVETAEWAEKALGQTEIAETNEGISYGVTELRDGRTASINRALRPIVLASQIRALEKFQYFLSMGSGLPVAPVQIAYKPRPNVAPSYVPSGHRQLVIDAALMGEPALPLFAASGAAGGAPKGVSERSIQQAATQPCKSSSEPPAQLPLKGGTAKKPNRQTRKPSPKGSGKNSGPSTDTRKPASSKRSRARTKVTTTLAGNPASGTDDPGSDRPGTGRPDA